MEGDPGDITAVLEEKSSARIFFVDE